MAWKTLGQALEGARSAGLIGFGNKGGNPLVETGGNETADGGDQVEIARPAGTEKMGGSETPPQVSRRSGGVTHRGRFRVIQGGLATAPADKSRDREPRAHLVAVG